MYSLKHNPVAQHNDILLYRHVVYSGNDIDNR